MQPSYLTAPGPHDILLLAPELVLIAVGVLLLGMQIARYRGEGYQVAAVGGMLAALASVIPLWDHLEHSARLTAGAAIPFLTRSGGAAPPLTAFHGNLVLDGFAINLKIIILVGSLLTALLAWRYAERFRNPAEFFALLVFATCAASLLTGAADLLMIYLSVEFLSISSYILVGYLKFQPRSTEASLKYFLYGAITAAVMLYGLSLVYGMAGTTNLYDLVGDARPSVSIGLTRAMSTPGGRGVVLIALVMVMVGFGFKTAMAPFHQWAPDVYDGAPLPVMAWLSVASKAAGMAVLVRVLFTVFSPEAWVFPLAVLAALTMTVGNLAALPQTNIKRMLAYSSVAHAGYTLMAVVALGAAPAAESERAGLENPWQMYGVAVYLAVYVFMNLGALAVVAAVYDRIKSHRIEDYAGLSQRAPALAWLMVFFLLSLAGIPPTAGFWGKFVLFAAVLDTRLNPNLIWLGIIGFLNSVVSVYYYWGVVRAMFLVRARTEEGVPVSRALGVTLALAAAGTLGLFLFAGEFMRWVARAG